MTKAKFEFSTKMWTIQANYESDVYVYEDKVVIKRTGRTGGLPSDSTIYYRDATAVSWGSAAGRSWITFTVPGVAARGNQVVTAVQPGTMVFSGPYIPYEDPFSIVFGLKQGNETNGYYQKIKILFDAYKASASTAPTAVQSTTIYQDGVMDKLRKLKELKDLGVLSTEEYEAKRLKLLSEI